MTASQTAKLSLGDLFGAQKMTYEMQQSLKRELDGAMQSGDANRIRCAQGNIMLALMDCQRKTAERVKKLSWKFTAAMFALGASGGTVASNWGTFCKIIFGN